MKYINTKLLLGSMLVLGATSCGSNTAYNGDDSKLTTNLSDTMNYNNTTYDNTLNNNDGFNYSLDNNYTGYNGTNGYLAAAKRQYANDYVNDYNKSIVDYRGQDMAKGYDSKSDNYTSTYESAKYGVNYQRPLASNRLTTDYDMLLEDTYDNDMLDMDYYNMDEMIANGKVENNINNDTVNRTLDDLDDLATTTMEEVKDMGNTLMNDTENTIDKTARTANDYVTTTNREMKSMYTNGVNTASDNLR